MFGRPSGSAFAHPLDRPARLRFVILFATLLAFGWQNFLADVHQHYGAVATSTVVAKSAGNAGVSRSGNAPDSPANCPLCRELIHAGSYVPPPGPLVVAAPLVTAVALIVAADFQIPARRRSHRWQSRAPPQPLQA